MTLAEFYEKLRNHDWYYDFSDDRRVWAKGKTAQNELESLANKSPETKKLFEDYKSAVWSHGKIPYPGQPE